MPGDAKFEDANRRARSDGTERASTQGNGNGTTGHGNDGHGRDSSGAGAHSKLVTG